MIHRSDTKNDPPFDDDVIKVTMSFNERKFHNGLGFEGIPWLLNRLGDVKSYDILYFRSRYEVVAVYDQFRLPKKEKALAFATNCSQRHVNKMNRNSEHKQKQIDLLQAILNDEPQ